MSDYALWIPIILFMLTFGLVAQAMVDHVALKVFLFVFGASLGFVAWLYSMILFSIFWEWMKGKLS